LKFLLVGQPNSGKSTIFNEVVGYKAIATNFPGATVKYTSGTLSFEEHTVEVVDIPGTYSLQTTDEAESLAVHYLLHEEDEPVIVNIIDASVLSRSLELTIQLTELQKPMVVALNMIDEAEKKGIKIDLEKLSTTLGVPVIQTIGKKGVGVYELFQLAHDAYEQKKIPIIHNTGSELEGFIESTSALLKEKDIPTKWNNRFVSIKLLEKDPLINEHLDEFLSENDRQKIDSLLKKLDSDLGTESEYAISRIRHNMAFEIFEKVAIVARSTKTDIRYKIDDLLMHPILGYVFMVGILYTVFATIFMIGNTFEPLFLAKFDEALNLINQNFEAGSIMSSIMQGLVTGLGGGIGIVIPFLLPFFIFLSFLEDSGYLARIAYLIDSFMHKIGLHGLSVIPLILGYGCTVPGILATRILKSQRDKFITAALTTFIPCSARMTIIFGLVGFFISMKAAIFIYVLNLLVVGLSGKILSKVMPEVSPGLILEIPKYHLPSPKILFHKTWFRLKEFVIIAWPLLVVGSIILEVINHYQLTGAINSFMEPFTVGLLGFPAVLGVTLVFGIMRKELALILLFSAIGTQDVLSVLTEAQAFSYAIFVTFYLPCLATFAALAKELNTKKALLITAFTAATAIILVLIVRLTTPIFW